MALLSALFVWRQIVWFNRQLKLDTLFKISEINRELLIFGIERPELLEILGNGMPTSDEQRRYLQLWINQADIVYQAASQKLLTKEVSAALTRDIGEFFRKDGVILYWKEVEGYYSEGLRRFLGRAMMAPHQSTIKGIPPDFIE